MSRTNNTFTTVNRDRNLHTLKTTKQNKIPRANNLPVLKSNLGLEGDILLNKADRIFYGHNGLKWVQFSTSSGSYDDGFQATDSAGAAITDNAAAGIQVNGANSIAAGANSVVNHDNSIVINATGTQLSTTQSGFYIDPIRQFSHGFVLHYDPVTKEITHENIPTGTIPNGNCESDYLYWSETPSGGAWTPGSTDGNVHIGCSAATSAGGVAVGVSATSSSAANSIAIGNDAQTLGTDSAVVIGNSARGQSNAVAVGRIALATGGGSTSIGDNSQATTERTTAIGSLSRATALESTAVGFEATALAEGAIAIGRNTSATHTDSVVIGRGLGSTADNSLVLRHRTIAGVTAASWTASNELVEGAASSRAFKKDIEPLPNQGDNIDKLRPVSFKYREGYLSEDDPTTHYGLIAEEVHEVYPEFTLCTEGKPHNVAYDKIVSVLIKEVQALRARVASLEQ